MVFDPPLIIAWDQQDGQIPSLASRADQTPDKTCRPALLPGLRE